MISRLLSVLVILSEIFLFKVIEMTAKVHYLSIHYFQEINKYKTFRYSVKLIEFRTLHAVNFS